MNDRQFDDFDPYAKDYVKIHNQNIKISGTTSDYFSEERVSIVKKREGKKKPAKILDFGCGNGSTEIHMTKYFSKSEIFGIDPSKTSIAVAKKRKLPNCTFSPFDGKHIPFPDKSFDLIFVAGVLHHVEFSLHSQQLREMFRVLKKGGRIYIYEHNPFNPLTKKIVNTCVFDDQAIMLKSSYLKKSLHKVGFKNVQTSFLIFFPRHKFFKPLIALEKLLSWLPIGGKYYVRATK